MNVNYEYYKIFYYVAKYRSISGAAARLMMGQPNVSRVIKLLEQSLGCTLFVRSNRGVVLSAAGEKLLRQLAPAVEQIEDAQRSLLQDNRLESGRLIISVSETALHELVLSVLDDFRTQYPNIKLKMYNHSTPQAVAALRNKAVELAVVTTPTEATAPLKEIPLTAFAEVPVCGAKYSFLTQNPMSLAEMMQYPHISLDKNTATFSFYRAFFLENDLVPAPDMEAATTDQILAMVRGNLGLGFLPPSLARPAIARGEVYPVSLTEKLPERQVCLLKNRDRSPGLAARELERMLREKAAEI